MNIKLAVNDIYPTDESLDACWHRAKNSLPITTENELFALFNIHQNTIINQLNLDTEGKEV